MINFIFGLITIAIALLIFYGLGLLFCRVTNTMEDLVDSWGDGKAFMLILLGFLTACLLIATIGIGIIILDIGEEIKNLIT